MARSQNFTQRVSIAKAAIDFETRFETRMIPARDIALACLHSVSEDQMSVVFRSHVAHFYKSCWKERISWDRIPKGIIGSIVI